jgi:hypothetical protein
LASKDDMKSDAPDPRTSRRRSPAAAGSQKERMAADMFRRWCSGGHGRPFVEKAASSTKSAPRRPSPAPRGQQRSGVCANAKERAARLTVSPPSRLWGEVGAERRSAVGSPLCTAGRCHLSLFLRGSLEGTLRTVLAVRLHRFDVSHTARAESSTCETSPIDETPRAEMSRSDPHWAGVARPGAGLPKARPSSHPAPLNVQPWTQS